MTIVVVVLAVLVLVAVTALATDVALGSSPRAAITRPQLALQRVAYDAYRLFKPGDQWPGSDWASRVGPPFTDPGRLAGRQEPIGLARRDLGELAMTLGTITYDQDWGAAAVAELAMSVRDARWERVRDGGLTLDARADGAPRFTIVLYGRVEADESTRTDQNHREFVSNVFFGPIRFQYRLQSRWARELPYCGIIWSEPDGLGAR